MCTIEMCAMSMNGCCMNVRMNELMTYCSFVCYPIFKTQINTCVFLNVLVYIMTNSASTNMFYCMVLNRCTCSIKVLVNLICNKLNTIVLSTVISILVGLPSIDKTFIVLKNHVCLYLLNVIAVNYVLMYDVYEFCELNVWLQKSADHCIYNNE